MLTDVVIRKAKTAGNPWCSR